MTRSLRPSFLLSLLLGIALLTVLAACGDQPTPEPPAANGEPVVVAGEAGTGAQGQVGAAGQATGGQAAPALAAPTPTPTPPAGRIVLWHSWAGADGDALTAILDTFRRDYPQVTVDTLFVAYPDLPKTYADGVTNGTGPDLVLAPTWWISDFVRIGVVQPLDTLVPAEEVDALVPAAVDNLRWNGQLYGLPTNYELVSLYVNTALSPNGPPATTADMLAQAQAAPTQGAGLYNSLYHLYWGIPAYGGTLFDPNGTVTLDQGGDVAGYLAWLRAMAQSPGTFVDTDYGMLLDRFKKGEFAYFVDGPWALADLRTALGDNLVVALLPAGPAGPAGPWLHADGVMVNPRVSPEQQQLAALFARHLVNAESGALLADKARRLPGNRNAQLPDDALLRGFAAQAATAQAMPNLPEMEQVWGYGGDMLIKVVDGNADPATTVKETSALINEANGK